MSGIHYSVVVPAFRENGNLRPLVTRIFGALSQAGSPVSPHEVEVIIVDDNSRDGSVETVEDLRRCTKPSVALMLEGSVAGASKTSWVRNLPCCWTKR